MVSLPEQRRSRHAWTRRIATVIEQHRELTVEDFSSRILRDVRRRIEPAQAEAEMDPTAPDATVSYYRRPSWRGAFWAALFIAAIRRQKMSIQREARDRLYDLSPGTVKFVEARIGEILSVDTVNHNLRRQSQPHRRWVNALLASAPDLPRHRRDRPRRRSERQQPHGLGSPSCAGPQTFSAGISPSRKKESGRFA